MCVCEHRSVCFGQGGRVDDVWAEDGGVTARLDEWTVLETVSLGA